jgi:c-di-GMP-binding flagellar brake protein YcgR
MQDRRTFLRIRNTLEVGFAFSDGSIEYLRTVDVSRGGIQLHAEHSVEEGEQFTVVMSIFRQPGDEFLPVRARIQIVHKEYDGEFRVFHLGAMFVSFEGEGQAIYEQWVRELERI